MPPTVTLTKGGRSKVFRLYDRPGGANKLQMQNVKEVLGLSTLELDGINEASDAEGYSISAFEPGTVIQVSGEPALQPSATASGENGCYQLCAHVLGLSIAGMSPTLMQWDMGER